MDVDQDQQARTSLGRAPLLNRDVALRITFVAALVAFFAFGYFGIGRNVDPSRARELATALDRRIPFIPATVWVYLAMFPTALSPLVLVRPMRLFRRTCGAYAAAIGVSLILFAAFPVTSKGLRAQGGALDPLSLSSRAVALLYRLDPPFNLFPSLHLSIAAIALLSAWKAARLPGAAVGLMLAVIGVSVCTVKQHFVLDALGGLTLAAVVYAVVLRPYRASPEYDGISSSRNRNAIR